MQNQITDCKIFLEWHVLACILKIFPWSTAATNQLWRKLVNLCARACHLKSKFPLPHGPSTPNLWTSKYSFWCSQKVLATMLVSGPIFLLSRRVSSQLIVVRWRETLPDSWNTLFWGTQVGSITMSDRAWLLKHGMIHSSQTIFQA